MPSWRQDGRFVFEDYVMIANAKENFSNLLDKHNISIVLLKTVEKEKKLDKPAILEKWFLSILERSPSKNIHQELINAGWQAIYKDKTAIILQKLNVF